MSDSREGMNIFPEKQSNENIRKLDQPEYPMVEVADIRYRHSQGVHLESVAGHSVLCYPQGGRVAVDPLVANLWIFAERRTLAEALRDFEPGQASRDTINATLACLCEADLLERENDEVVLPAAKSQLIFPLGTDAPLVSIVIIAFNGTDWLKDCLPSIQAQTYPSIETIMIDNASTDHTMETWVKNAYPHVQIHRLEKPLSFAAANNLAVGYSHGQYLFLLNQDTRLAEDAVAQLVFAAKNHPHCGAIAAKLKLWWAPKFLNGLGNHVRDFSWGSDLGFGLLDLGQLDHWEEVPSACFAATLISRQAWDEIGPIDPGFIFYYEDSEWCYRARILGYQIIAAPGAVVYHAFGGRVPSGASGGLSPFKQRRASYGRLRFARQITGELTKKFLRNYRVEDQNNLIGSLVRGRIGSAWAILGAYWDIFQTRHEIEKMRQSIKNRAKVSAETVFQTTAEIPPVFEWNGLPKLAWTDIQRYYLPLILQGRTRKMPEFEVARRHPNLLIVSNDVVDTKMAGPGIRYLEMAKALSKKLDVTLAVPGKTTLDVPGIRLVTYQENAPDGLMVLINNHDQSLISGYMVLKFPDLKKAHCRLIVDMYDPFFLENLNYYIHESIEAQNTHNRLAVKVMNQLAQVGDFFICGNERQRDLWMGLLAANGRVNPRTFLQDDSLRQLIDIVGVGIPSRRPACRPYLRGNHPAFDEESQIVLWGGGIWNWLDPITLAKAWPQVISRHPKARLVFLGTRHPNPQVPKHEIVDRLITVAEESGEKDRSIFFIEWVPFEDREALLTESNIGVTLHPIHVETRYSIRTRVLDYFWARLPTLITAGDVTSEWIEKYGVGRTVPELDVNATALALNEMLDKPKEAWQAGFDEVQAQFAWEKVTQPLSDFCFRGIPSPDHGTGVEEENREHYFKVIYDDIGSPVKKAAYLWSIRGIKAAIDQTIFHLKFLFSRH